MRPPPDQKPPLLHGPDEVTEGYFELEALERNVTLDALSKHRDAVALWYRALTLYRQRVLGEWHFAYQDGAAYGPMAYRLQSQLLGLGVSSAKAALDMLLAGYYSVAYAAIRHMLETVIQVLYVLVNPDEAKLWFLQPGGPDAQIDPPRCKRMVDAIAADPSLPEAKPFVANAYKAWQTMCKGAHPSGHGIVQTLDPQSGQFVIGATYDRDLCLAGFDHGFYAVLMLLRALLWMRPDDDDWNAALEELKRDVRRWREALASSLAPEQAET